MNFLIIVCIVVVSGLAFWVGWLSGSAWCCRMIEHDKEWSRPVSTTSKTSERRSK